MTRKFAIGAFLISLVIAGCAAPAAQGTQAASNTANASAGGTPSVSPTTPSATSVPTGTPAPSLAFEAPGDILPPWSKVVVVVDALQVRAEAGLNGPVHFTASAGEVFQVFNFPPVVVDGLDWYRLAIIPDAMTWVAAGSGADRYLELVPPDCPEADPDLAAVVLMTPWEHLACFGDRPLTFEGTFGCHGCGGITVGDFEPAWLAYPMNFDWLFPNYASGGGYHLELRFAPDSNLELPAQGSIVRVTGHFNDPRSATCGISTFEGEQAAQLDSRTAELTCRERFVVDGFEVIGTDPDFP